MISPAHDESSLLEDLNRYSNAGHVLDGPLIFRQLERKIAIYKTLDVAAYWVHMAALHCLYGDREQSIRAGHNGLRLTSEPRYYDYHLKTLSKMGAFQRIREIFNKQPPDFFALEPFKCSYHLVAAGGYSRCREIAGCVHPEETPMINIGVAAAEVLADSGIEEARVQSMIDLAGSFLMSRRLLGLLPHHVEVYPGDRTISINMAIATSPREAATLEWDFSEHLFTVMPDCPATVVHIGFVSSQGAEIGM